MGAPRAETLFDRRSESETAALRGSVGRRELEEIWPDAKFRED